MRTHLHDLLVEQADVRGSARERGADESVTGATLARFACGTSACTDMGWRGGSTSSAPVTPTTVAAVSTGFWSTLPPANKKRPSTSVLSRFTTSSSCERALAGAVPKLMLELP